MTLHLNKCSFQERGSVALLEALQRNEHLSTISLGINQVGAAAAINALCACIAGNTSLISLDLADCQISKEAGKRLAQTVVASSKTLMELNLKFNNVTTESLGEIREVLAANKSSFIRRQYNWTVMAPVLAFSRANYLTNMCASIDMVTPQILDCVFGCTGSRR